MQCACKHGTRTRTADKAYRKRRWAVGGGGDSDGGENNKLGGDIDGHQPLRQPQYEYGG